MEAFDASGRTVSHATGQWGFDETDRAITQETFRPTHEPRVLTLVGKFPAEQLAWLSGTGSLSSMSGLIEFERHCEATGSASPRCLSGL